MYVFIFCYRIFIYFFNWTLFDLNARWRRVLTHFGYLENKERDRACYRYLSVLLNVTAAVMLLFYKINWVYCNKLNNSLYSFLSFYISYYISSLVSMILHHIHTYVYVMVVASQPQQQQEPECDPKVRQTLNAMRVCYCGCLVSETLPPQTTHPRRSWCRRRRLRQQRRWQWQRRWRWQRERDFSHKWRSSNVAKSSCYCSGFLLLLHANRSATSRLCIINSFCMSGSSTPDTLSSFTRFHAATATVSDTW